MIFAAWKPGSRYGADAQKVADEISGIGDSATPAQILDKARDNKSELQTISAYRSIRCYRSRGKGGRKDEADKRRIHHAKPCCTAELNNVSHFSMVSIPWIITGSAAINANSKPSKAIQLSANHFRRALRLESFSCSRCRATYCWTFSFLDEPDRREPSRLAMMSSLFSICGAGGTNRLFKQNTSLSRRLYHGRKREGRNLSRG